MEIKSTYSSQEFRELQKKGVFVPNGKRMKLGKLLPEYEALLDNEEKQKTSKSKIDIIGIDPDLDKSGVAKMKDGKLIICTNYDMEDLFKFLHTQKDCVILLEAGHENKNTWHKGCRGIAKNVGKGQAIGILIEQFLKKHKFTYRLIPPAGYSNYFNDEKYFKEQTAWQERTNKDSRASAAMVFLNNK